MIWESFVRANSVVAAQGKIDMNFVKIYLMKEFCQMCIENYQFPICQYFKSKHGAADT